MFVSDVDGLVSKMKALQQRGIGIALDDFGTGYSSLSYLRQLPLQHLKIDRSFVRATTTKRGALLVRSIAQMGHDLGLEILAEGIETDEQFQFMLDCGCSAFQGYHFGRPLALQAFEDRFLEGRLIGVGVE
jgi:EAL domain-containing protein (putative c-di-GMP-specific phosphodiesterase class I)